MKSAVIDRSLGVRAALFAALCLSAPLTHDVAGGESKVTLVYKQELLNGPGTSVRSVLLEDERGRSSGRVASQRLPQEQDMRALLRAIQAIVHLARTVRHAMAARFSRSGWQWLRALAAFSLGARADLTVGANGSDAAPMPWHAV